MMNAHDVRMYSMRPITRYGTRHAEAMQG